MSKSGRVSAAQELAIARLVGECRELGDDAAAWQGHLIAQVQRLVGIAVMSVGPSTPGGSLAKYVDGEMGGGWPSDRVKKAMHEWLRNSPQAVEHPAVVRFLQTPGPTVIRTRRQLVADREWDAHPFVNDFLRANELDEGAIGRVAIPGDPAVYAFTVIRTTGEPPLTAREGRVCARLFDALTPHLGRSLLLTTQPNRHGLPPRLIQVLDSLLDGDSEKQAAARLGIHPATVHQHVKRLYRHFGVSSRAELLAYFLRRYRRGGG